MEFNISQPEIIEAIYKTILAAYTKPPIPGMPSPSQNQKLFINYVWPGKNLDETAYQNPWQPSNKSGSQLSTENISNLVNSIPLLSKSYNLSGNLVEKIYKFILLASPIPLATRRLQRENGLKVEKNSSESERYVKEDYDDLKQKELERQYANACANLVVNRLQYNLLDPVEKDIWEKSVLKFEQAVNYAWDLIIKHKSQKLLWKSNIGRHLGESSMNEINVINALKDYHMENPVSRVLDGANKVFMSTSLSSIINPTLVYHPSYVTPLDFALRENSKDWPFAPAIPVKTAGNIKPNLTISFRFCRVDIQRPWLTMILLEMNGWKINGQSAGSFSNGQSIDNLGSFPLLPSSFIVARDLVISGTEGNSGVEYYSAKGLQILAFINRITPFIPPNE